MAQLFDASLRTRTELEETQDDRREMNAGTGNATMLDINEKCVTHASTRLSFDGERLNLSFPTIRLD
jgi:hypothetical protein